MGTGGYLFDVNELVEMGAYHPDPRFDAENATEAEIPDEVPRHGRKLFPRNDV